MGANQNPLKGAIICSIAVVCALGNGTFDALICFAIHSLFLLFIVIHSLCPKPEKQCVFPISKIDI